MQKKNPQHLRALIPHVWDYLADNSPYPLNHLPQAMINETYVHTTVRIKLVNNFIRLIKSSVLSAYHGLLMNGFERRLSVTQ